MWIVADIISIFGGMINAEIGAMILFKVMGVGGASVIALLIMISTADATNGNILQLLG